MIGPATKVRARRAVSVARACGLRFVAYAPRLMVVQEAKKF